MYNYSVNSVKVHPAVFNFKQLIRVSLIKNNNLTVQQFLKSLPMESMEAQMYQNTCSVVVVAVDRSDFLCLCCTDVCLDASGSVSADER